MRLKFSYLALLCIQAFSLCRDVKDEELYEALSFAGTASNEYGANTA